MTWQPIETYPVPPFTADKWFMNGDRCLIAIGYVDMGSYGFTQKGKGRWQNTLGHNCAPTHWMPLPDKPC